MSIKIECDGCGKQVSNEAVALNGWLVLNQVENVPTMDQVDLGGNFCTASCVVRYLINKGVVVPDLATPTEGEGEHG